MLIFETKVRDDETPMYYMEDSFEYLDRSSKLEAEAARTFLSIKFEVRHFLQMRMNILRWCPIPKSFAWARI